MPQKKKHQSGSSAPGVSTEMLLIALTLESTHYFAFGGVECGTSNTHHVISMDKYRHPADPDVTSECSLYIAMITIIKTGIVAIRLFIVNRICTRTSGSKHQGGS